jgi:hypothetical protein
MDKDFVPVRVYGVSADPGDGLPLVLLVDECAGEGVRLQIGPFEASAIIMELEGIVPPRPLTHDLLASLFRETRTVLQRAELFGCLDEGPRARLVYRRGLLRHRREVRPSDALALAVRLGAPILAQRTLLESREKAELGISALKPETGHLFLKTASRTV